LRYGLISKLPVPSGRGVVGQATLVHATRRAYVISIMARLFPMLLLALALAGAPFGMGRMMDGAHGPAHAAMLDHSAHAGHHRGQDLPAADHPATTPHFTLCAACIGAVAQSPQPVMLAVMTGRIEAAMPDLLTGIAKLPPTPPPRA
jgi:hypothetical protein